MSGGSETNPPPYSDEFVSPSPPPPYDPALYSLPSPSGIQRTQNHPPRTVFVPVRALVPPSFRPNPHTTNNATQTPTGEPVSLVTNEDNLTWIPAFSSIALHLSGKAVIGGYEFGGSPLWVIRAKHNGYLVPGKFSVRTSTASIPFGNKEVAVQNIEVLCARPDNLQWVPANKGVIPPNAVKGGRTLLGADLFVGRTRYQQTLIPGKVQRKDKCHIGFGGSVVSVQFYEVLCTIR